MTRFADAKASAVLKEYADWHNGIEIRRASDSHWFVFQLVADALKCVVARLIVQVIVWLLPRTSSIARKSPSGLEIQHVSRHFRVNRAVLAGQILEVRHGPAVGGKDKDTDCAAGDLARTTRASGVSIRYGPAAGEKS
jgi:hypothetical protein